MFMEKDTIFSLRKAVGETQAEFAQRCGVSMRTVVRWEDEGVADSAKGEAKQKLLETKEIVEAEREPVAIVDREVALLRDKIIASLHDLGVQELTELAGQAKRMQVKALIKSMPDLAREALSELDADQGALADADADAALDAGETAKHTPAAGA